MKKLPAIALLFFVLSTMTSLAQNKTDEGGVKECLQQYMSGTGDRVEKAFHPSATMK